MSTQPAIPRLDIPSPLGPSDETALFQHNPSSGSKVKQEWEPGCQPDEVYDAALPAWRAGARRYLVNRLRGEREWMAEWQESVRTEKRDVYFYWTAIFGTHTFFMTFLPLFFWYGPSIKARGMLNAVGLGIYISSFSKDLVCTPRPYSPPIVRIAMSTHAHEYGFPSSHSTNSFTIALFLAQWLWETQDAVGWYPMLLADTVLLVYVVSVVGGRVYTGMHSIADIVGGSLMGIACWIVGLFGQRVLEAWTLTGSAAVPLFAIPITFAGVHYHPEPVDPCPCFEDAIAVLAVMLGGVLGRWYEIRHGLAASALSTEIWAGGIFTGLMLVVERLVIGIALLFGWRIVAKSTLLRTLPAIFRFFSSEFDFDLPTRKGYTAATEYDGHPSTSFRPVPSFVDLGGADSPSTDATPTDSPSALTGTNGHAHLPGHLSPLVMPEAATLRKRVSIKQAAAKAEKLDGATPRRNNSERKKRRPTAIKFDVEVLTKVIVYFGIGLLATTVMPYLHSCIEDRLFGVLRT